MVMHIDAMLSFLVCPRTKTKLNRRDSDELISETGERYPIVNGKPILVREIRDSHLRPPLDSLISRNIQEFMPPAYLGETAIAVNLGSGDVPSPDQRVVSLDIL